MVKKTLIRIGCVLISMLYVLSIVSCGTVRRPEEGKEPSPPGRGQQVQKPDLPAPIKTQGNQEPRLKVFIVEEDRVEEMAFEEYVAGVVGGEIKNDWPEEAIKAQVIIARTFVLQFIDEKGKSKYENAHVSTDIEEAQAWNMEAVNDRIRSAVKATRGEVIVYQGKFARTWFHSNAAGKTATAAEGLAYKEPNPPYIQVTDSPDDAPEIPADEANWTASFQKQKVLEALRQAGIQIQDFSTVSIGEKGPSGRALNLRFDQTSASAPPFRIALGSKEMKSTLLDSVALEGDQVVFRGRGFGHGVGMSQWGAFHMASQDKTAEEIINHYFAGIGITKMWD